MGRKADTAATKKAKGNPGRRKIVEGTKTPDGEEIVPAALPGEMPNWFDTHSRIPKNAKGRGTAERLTKLTREVWNSVYPELNRLNLVAQMDEVPLGLWCRAVAEWIDCTVEIDREGSHYETSSPHSKRLLREHPAVRIRARAERTIDKFGSDLGLTPAARQSLFMKLAAAGVQGLLPGMNKAANSNRDDTGDSGELPIAPKPRVGFLKSVTKR